MNPYKTQIRNGTTFYQCLICEVMGNVEETISKGYCHKISNSRHREDERLTSVRKKQINKKIQ